MAGGQCGGSLPWHQAQQGNAGALAKGGERLPQQVGVARTAHMGADHAQKGKGFVFCPGGPVVQKALCQRGNRLPHAPGIEHQQQGQPQQGCQMGRAASAPVPAVKQAHGTFYNQNIWQNVGQNMGQNVGRGGSCATCQRQATGRRHACKNALQPRRQTAGWPTTSPQGPLCGRGRSFAAHPGIEVGGWLTGKGGVEGRINIVWPGFGRPRHKTPLVQGAEQGQGKGSFAGIAARAAYDKAGQARQRLGHGALRAGLVSVAAGPRL